MIFVKRHRSLLALLVVSTLVGGNRGEAEHLGQPRRRGGDSHVLGRRSRVSRSLTATAVPQDLQTLQTARGALRPSDDDPAGAGRDRQTRWRYRPIRSPASPTSPATCRVQFSEAGSEEHASQLVASNAPYRLELQADRRSEPILTIYAEAPSVDQALRLANCAVRGFARLPAGAGRRGSAFRANELPHAASARGRARRRDEQQRKHRDRRADVHHRVCARPSSACSLLIRRPWRRREAGGPG